MSDLESKPPADSREPSAAERASLQRAQLKLREAELELRAEHRAGLLLEAASLAIEDGGVALALRCCKQVLALLPEYPPALVILERMATLDADSGREALLLLSDAPRTPEAARTLVRISEAQLARTASVPERVAMLCRLAGIWAGPLGDPESAFLAAGRALRESPADARALELCSSLAVRAKAQEELEALLEDLAPRAAEATTRERLRAALARISSDEAEKGAKDPVTQLVRQLNRTNSASEQFVLLMKLGELQERMADPAAAAEAYQEAFTLDPRIEALRPLERVLAELGRAREQAEVLARLAAIAPESAKAEWLFKRAEVLEGAGDWEGAVDGYEALLQAPADSALVLRNLERLMEREGSLRGRVLPLLARVYASQKEIGKLVPLLELQLASTHGLGEVPLLRQLAEARESRGEFAESFALCLRAFSITPEDEQLRGRLIRLAVKVGSEEKVVSALEKALAAELPPEIAVELWRELASLYGGRLAQPREAARAWEEVARRVPGDREPLEELTGIYREAGSGRALAEVLERRIALGGDPAQRLALWKELANLAENTLASEVLAVRAHQEILELSADERESLRALDRHFTRTHREFELASVLEREVRLASAPSAGIGEQTEIELRLGRLRASHLNDGVGALELFQKILGREPGHAGSTAALEELVSTEGLTPAIRLQASTVLVDTLRRQTDPARLVRALEERAALEPEPVARSAMLLQAAAVLGDSLEQPKAAFHLAAEGLRLQPADRRALDLISALAERAQLHEPLVVLLSELLPSVVAGEPRALLARALAFARQHQGQVQASIEAWQGVLEAQPQDVEALSALDRIFESQGRHPERVFLLEQQLPLLTSPDARTVLARRLALAQEAAGNLEAALEWLERDPAVNDDTELLLAQERILGALARPAPQAQVLQRLIQLGAETKEIGSDTLLLRRAEALVQAGLEEPAVQAYAELLRRRGSEAQAILGLESLLARPTLESAIVPLLEPVYRQAQDVLKLASLLEIRVKHEEGEARWGVLSELSRLREGAGDLDGAWRGQLAAFQLRPDDEDTVRELERLAMKRSASADLANEYQSRMEREATANVRVKLGRRLAAIQEGQLAQPDAAAASWEVVLREAPEDGAALQALARLYLARERYADLVRVRLLQLRHEPHLEGQLSLLSELAQLGEEKLADASLVERSCRQILAHRSRDPRALERLARALMNQGRHAESAQVLELEIAVAQEAAALGVVRERRVALAELQCLHLGQPEQALGLLREVLREDPKHPTVVRVLEQLLKVEGPARAAAGELLEPWYRAANHHRGLVDALEARTSAASSPAERVTLLQQVSALLAGPLQDVPAAFAVALRALREFPEDRRSLQLCVELGARAQRLPELVAQLADLSTRTADGEAKAALLLVRARLQDELGPPDEAAGAWSDVLRIRPGDAETLGALEILYTRLERWPALLEVLGRQRSLATDGDRQLQLLRRMAGLQEERLGDDAGAVATLEAVVAERLDDRSSLERLARLLERLERWPELMEVMSRRAELEPEHAVAHRLQRALIQDERLGDSRGAVPKYAEILEVDPDQPRALERLAMYLVAEPQDGLAWETRLGALRRRPDLPALRAALAERIQVSPQLEERRALWVELSTVLEGEGDLRAAFVAQSGAVRESPADVELRARLLELANISGTWSALAQLFEELVASSAEIPGRGEICFVLGQVYEQQLGEVDEAVRWYTAAGDAGPELRLRALGALETLWTRLARWPELAEVLSQRSAHETEVSERVALLFRLSRLALERLQSPERAAAALESILAVAPATIPALDELERLYREMNRPPALFDLLGRYAAVVDGREREGLLLRQVSVAAGPLARPEEALALAQKCLEGNPRSDAASLLIEGLLSRLGRWDELALLLRSRIDRLLDPMEVARLHERLAVLERDTLHRPAEAARHFLAVLEREPRSMLALRALRDLFETLNRPPELAGVLEKLAALEREGQGAKGIHLRWAEVLSHLGERERALEVARKALTVVPHSEEELERLRQTFVQLGSVADVATVLDLRAELERGVGEKGRSLETLFEVVDLWKDAGLASRGAGAIEKVLALEPSHPRGYRMAEELYTATANWPALASMLERRATALPPGAEQVAALRQLITVQRDRLGEAEAAFRSACRALQLQPDDAELRAEAYSLADATRLHSELVVCYRALTKQLAWGPLSRQLHLIAARIEDEVLDQPGDAEATLQAVLDFDPTDIEALGQLASMLERRGRHREHADALVRTIEVASTRDVRRRLLRDLARVLDERLGDAAGAVSALRRAVELEPDEATVRALVQLEQRRLSWKGAVEALQWLEPLVGDEVERARVLEETADIYEKRLLNYDAAIASYQRALELDSGRLGSLVALEQIFIRLDRPLELRETLTRELAARPRGPEQVSVLLKLAVLEETRFRQSSRADSLLEQALQVEPGNPAVIEHLKRLRRAEGRWPDLVRALDHQVQVSKNASEKAELWVQKGELQLHQLGDPDAASVSFNQALQLDGRNPRTLHALAELNILRQEWRAALGFLQREAAAVPESAHAAELLFRAAKIQEEALQQLEAAKGSYASALSRDPTHRASRRALVGLCEATQDWTTYERTLFEEAQALPAGPARAEPLVALGRHFVERRKDGEAAARCYEQALEVAPQWLEAARPLASIRLAKQDWRGAEKMLEIVVAQLDQPAARRDRAGDHALATELCRLGVACERGAQAARALQAFTRAVQVDSSLPEALGGKARLLAASGKGEEALAVYGNLLLLQGYDEGTVEVHARMGDLLLELGQTSRAREHFERAVAMQPRHEHALRALIQLADQAGQEANATTLRERLVGALEGPSKFAACVELGTLAQQRGDLARAIDAFNTALDVDATALTVLERLYQVYRAVRSAKAVEVLERMLALPEVKQNGDHHKQLQLTLGQIAANELRDVNRAVHALQTALDIDPEFEPAYETLERLLSTDRRWSDLERSYERIIARLPPGAATHRARMRWWRKLGELRHTVLHNPEAASEAYQHAAEGSPEDADVQELFAAVAAKLPGQEQAAREAYRRALLGTSRPSHVSSALARLLVRGNERDVAYLGLRAMEQWAPPLGEEEVEFLKQVTPLVAENAQAFRALSSPLWQRHLLHPSLQGPLTAIFTHVFRSGGPRFALGHVAYGVHPKKHRVDATASPRLSTLRYAGRLLAVDGIELLSLGDPTGRGIPAEPAGPAIVPCLTEPLSLRVGARFWAADESLCAALLAYGLASLRPELILARTLPPERLESVLLAAIRLVTRRHPPNADLREVKREQRLLEKAIEGPTLEALGTHVRAYLTQPDDGPPETKWARDVRRYVRGAELSCLRAVLFVTADPSALQRLGIEQADLAENVPQAQRVRELLQFAFSSDLHALREATGTAIAQAVGGAA